MEQSRYDDDDLRRYNEGEDVPGLSRALAEDPALRDRQVVMALAAESARSRDPVHRSHAATVTEEAIGLYLMGGGGLGDAERRRIERALADCQVCEARGRRIRGELTAFGAPAAPLPQATPAQAAPPGLVDRALGWLRWAAGTPLVAATAALALAIGLIQQGGQWAGPPRSAVDHPDASGRGVDGGPTTRGEGRAEISISGILYRQLEGAEDRWRPAGQLNQAEAGGAIPQCPADRKLDVLISGSGGGCLTLWRRGEGGDAERLYVRADAQLSGSIEHLPRPASMRPSEPTTAREWIDLSGLSGDQSFIIILQELSGSCVESTTPEWLETTLATEPRSAAVASLMCEVKR